VHLLVLLRICKSLTMHRMNSLQLNHLLMRGKEICYYTETQYLFSLFLHVTENIMAMITMGTKYALQTLFQLFLARCHCFDCEHIWHGTSYVILKLLPNFHALLRLLQSQTFLYYSDKRISSMKICSPTFIHM
jgi:hypothetical protein